MKDRRQSDCPISPVAVTYHSGGAVAEIGQSDWRRSFIYDASTYTTTMFTSTPTDKSRADLAYDVNGRIATISDQRNGLVTITWDESNNPTTAIQPRTSIAAASAFGAWTWNDWYAYNTSTSTYSGGSNGSCYGGCSYDVK